MMFCFQDPLVLKFSSRNTRSQRLFGSSWRREILLCAMVFLFTWNCYTFLCIFFSSTIYNVETYDQFLLSPRGAWAFDELRRYHTRPLRFNCGSVNVHFEKTQARVLFLLENLKNYQAQLFICCVFHYSTKKWPKKRSEVQKTPKNDLILLFADPI